MPNTLEYIKERQRVIITRIKLKNEAIGKASAMASHWRQVQYKAQESLSNLQHEYRALEEEKYRLEHPPSAEDMLKEVEREFGLAIARKLRKQLVATKKAEEVAEVADKDSPTATPAREEAL